MKMERSILLELARKVEKGIDNKSIIPVMKCVRIEAKNNRVMLSSVSSTISICAEAECEEEQQMDCIVEGNKLTSILSKLTGEEVELKLKTDFLQIISGKTSIKLHTMDTSQWINIPEFVPETAIDVKLEDIQKVLHAVGKNNHNGQTFMCICIQVYEEGYQITALDGYRISQRMDKPTGDLLGEYLIEAAFIEKALALTENSAVLECNNNKIRISTDKISVFGSLTDGKYFNLGPIRNVKLPHMEKINKNRLLEELQVAKVINENVLFTFDDVLHISAKNMTDHFETELQYEATLDKLANPISLGMKVDYLIDALKSIDEEIIMVSFESAKSQLRMTSDTYVEIVMPKILS